MARQRHQLGVVDTSVAVDLGRIEPERLPVQIAITSVTLAELAAGPHATGERVERARRQEHLQIIESRFDPLPFDAAAARAYGRIYGMVLAAGRKARGHRALDLMIAAIALSLDLPVYTKNANDLAGLDPVVAVVSV